MLRRCGAFDKSTAWTTAKKKKKFIGIWRPRFSQSWGSCVPTHWKEEWRIYLCQSKAKRDKNMGMDLGFCHGSEQVWLDTWEGRAKEGESSRIEILQFCEGEGGKCPQDHELEENPLAFRHGRYSMPQSQHPHTSPSLNWLFPVSLPCLEFASLGNWGEDPRVGAEVSHPCTWNSCSRNVGEVREWWRFGNVLTPCHSEQPTSFPTSFSPGIRSGCPHTKIRHGRALRSQSWQAFLIRSHPKAEIPKERNLNSPSQDFLPDGSIRSVQIHRNLGFSGCFPEGKYNPHR